MGKVLQIPDRTEGIFSKINVLKDLPYLGKNYKIRKHIYRQLIKRRNLSWHTYWNDSQDIDVAKNVVKIFHEYSKFPDCVLFPDDFLRYIFVISNKDMESVAIMSKLSDEFGLPDNYFDGIDTVTFGDLVGSIREKRGG